MIHLEFMPRGACMLWKPHLVWWHTITDLMIATAYIFFPLVVALLAWYELSGLNPKRRLDLVLLGVVRIAEKVKYPSGMGWTTRIKHILYLSAFFILFCGMGHFIDVITTWQAHPYLKAINNTGTAAVSWITGISAVRHLPYFLKLIRHMAEMESWRSEP